MPTQTNHHCHYTYENDTYTLYVDGDALYQCHTIAIAFSRTKDATQTHFCLHKHGHTEQVKAWAEAVKESYQKAGFNDMAENLTIISGKIPVEQLNEIVDNNDRIKYLVDDFETMMQLYMDEKNNSDNLGETNAEQES